MKFSFTTSATAMIAVLALASAQNPPADRYQQIGNELGNFQSSVGQLRQANTANAYQLSSVAQAYDAVLATSIPELRTTGFENLAPEAAKQHAQNVEQYVGILLNDNAQLHEAASKAASQESQERQLQVNNVQTAPPQAYQGQYIRPGNFLAATGIPGFRNKAVVKEESASTTSDAPSSTEAHSSTDSENSKEPKSESKQSKSEIKSESKESKSESKSESRASKKSQHGAAANGTSAASTHVAAASNNATTVSSQTKTPKSKNVAAAYSVSGGAIVAGAMLALL